MRWYGNNRQLTDAWEEEGEVFLMDVASQRQSVGSRSASRSATATAGRKERGFWSAFKSRESERHLCAIRHCGGIGQRRIPPTKRGSSRSGRAPKGKLKYRIWVKEVWQWEIGESKARRRLLVVREEADSSFKYSLTNAAAHTSWERLGFMQAQRFWIERSFQDAKKRTRNGRL